MRTIVHLSDLHFGASDPALVAAVIDEVRRLAPDVIAVSGDLTQRARHSQFRAARAFLEALPAPIVVVPGNHDVPLYNIFARFVSPLRAYRRHVGGETDHYVDEEVAVLGADTTRAFTVKDGGLTQRDVARLLRRLETVPSAAVRVIVCHHPFDAPRSRAARWTRPAPWNQAVATLVTHGVDLFLTGHRHLSFAGHTAARYRIEGRSAIVVEAGTATSVRARGEANAFNVVRITRQHITVERLAWQAVTGQYYPAHLERFDCAATGWAPTEPSTLHLPFRSV
jgi:3',5'-cyclic AMP phosphodiesterase CpdA